MSRGVKIALAVGLVVLVVVAIFVVLQRNNQNSNLATDTQTPTDDIYAPDTTAISSEPDLSATDTASVDQTDVAPGESAVAGQPGSASTIVAKATATKTATKKPAVNIAASVTPYPGSGYLDWTRNDNIDRQALLDNTAARNTSAAKISGLSDSWSNPVEKFVYDSLDFMDKVVMEGLNSLSCMLSLTMLHENVNKNLQTQYVNGECRIIDR